MSSYVSQFAFPWNIWKSNEVWSSNLSETFSLNSEEIQKSDLSCWNVWNQSVPCSLLCCQKSPWSCPKQPTQKQTDGVLACEAKHLGPTCWWNSGKTWVALKTNCGIPSTFKETTLESATVFCENEDAMQFDVFDSRGSWWLSNTTHLFSTSQNLYKTSAVTHFFQRFLKVLMPSHLPLSFQTFEKYSPDTWRNFQGPSKSDAETPWCPPNCTFLRNVVGIRHIFPSAAPRVSTTVFVWPSQRWLHNSSEAVENLPHEA